MRDKLLTFGIFVACLAVVVVVAVVLAGALVALVQTMNWLF